MNAWVLLLSLYNNSNGERYHGKMGQLPTIQRSNGPSRAVRARRTNFNPLALDRWNVGSLGVDPYSYLSARIGSIRLALRAGITPAAADTIARSATVLIAIQGS